jgi:hypothetical protein
MMIACKTTTFFGLLITASYESNLGSKRNVKAALQNEPK